MVLSFHPCFIADQNIICAGRKPDKNDLSAIKKAEAVVLPQGCSELLYKMAKDNCTHVFPNFDARFQYPGKLNQIQLFQNIGSRYPKTETFKTTKDFNQKHGYPPTIQPFTFPIVFKFDWGGEGDMVFLVSSAEQLNDLIRKAEEFEQTGQSGFLIQEHIDTKGMSLRVNVIGRQLIAFWRIPENDQEFYSNLSKGAKIDYDLHPNLQEAGKKAVFDFCEQTQINLAGFDILFSFDTLNTADTYPLFLEINYFFGRRGLGGSEKFYEILVQEMHTWLSEIGLSVEAL